MSGRARAVVITLVVVVLGGVAALARPLVPQDAHARVATRQSRRSGVKS